MLYYGHNVSFSRTCFSSLCFKYPSTYDETAPCPGAVLADCGAKCVLPNLFWNKLAPPTFTQTVAFFELLMLQRTTLSLKYEDYRTPENEINSLKRPYNYLSNTWMEYDIIYSSQSMYDTYLKVFVSNIRSSIILLFIIFTTRGRYITIWAKWSGH